MTVVGAVVGDLDDVEGIGRRWQDQEPGRCKCEDAELPHGTSPFRARPISTHRHRKVKSNMQNILEWRGERTSELAGPEGARLKYVKFRHMPAGSCGRDPGHPSKRPSVAGIRLLQMRGPQPSQENSAAPHDVSELAERGRGRAESTASDRRLQVERPLGDPALERPWRRQAARRTEASPGVRIAPPLPNMRAVEEDSAARFIPPPRRLR